MKTFLKIINSIFPIYFWLLLLVGSLFLFTNIQIVFAYTLLNLVIMLFFIKLSVIIHEIGHLLFGKLAGGKPKRIVLGRSHEVIRFDILNIKIVLNKNFNGGFAFVRFPLNNNTKWRQFLLSAGGFLTNLLVSYLCYIVFGYNFSFLSGYNGLDFASAFIFVNVLLAIISLIPYHVDYMGVKIPTDGLTLLKLPFRKKNESNIDYNDFFEAQECLESKDYDEAIKLYKKYLDVKDVECVTRYNIGIIYLKKGNINEAFRWMKLSLNTADKEKNKMMYAHINNGLAWTKLVNMDYDDIDFHSKTAYSINPDFPYFIGTRGSVLIELGKIESGIKMLLPLVDFKFPNNQTLCTAMYLYRGMVLLNETKKAKKYFNFIIENIDKLDIDDKLLWKNILNRTEESQ